MAINPLKAALSAAALVAAAGLATMAYIGVGLYRRTPPAPMTTAVEQVNPAPTPIPISSPAKVASLFNRPEPNFTPASLTPKPSVSPTASPFEANSSPLATPTPLGAEYRVAYPGNGEEHTITSLDEQATLTIHKADPPQPLKVGDKPAHSVRFYDPSNKTYQGFYRVAATDLQAAELAGDFSPIKPTLCQIVGNCSPTLRFTDTQMTESLSGDCVDGKFCVEISHPDGYKLVSPAAPIPISSRPQTATSARATPTPGVTNTPYTPTATVILQPTPTTTLALYTPKQTQQVTPTPSPTLTPPTTIPSTPRPTSSATPHPKTTSIVEVGPPAPVHIVKPIAETPTPVPTPVTHPTTRPATHETATGPATQSTVYTTMTRAQEGPVRLEWNQDEGSATWNSIHGFGDDNSRTFTAPQTGQSIIVQVNANNCPDYVPSCDDCETRARLLFGKKGGPVEVAIIPINTPVTVAVSTDLAALLGKERVEIQYELVIPERKDGSHPQKYHVLASGRQPLQVERASEATQLRQETKKASLDEVGDTGVWKDCITGTLYDIVPNIASTGLDKRNPYGGFAESRSQPTVDFCLITGETSEDKQVDAPNLWQRNEPASTSLYDRARETEQILESSLADIQDLWQILDPSLDAALADIGFDQIYKADDLSLAA